MMQLFFFKDNEVIIQIIQTNQVQVYIIKVYTLYTVSR